MNIGDITDKEMNDFFDDFDKLNEILEKQYSRFYDRLKSKKNNFSELVEKIIDKYESNEYRDRWYNRGFEPEESLYFFLYYFAVKYGREATPNEYKRYSNEFISGIYYFDKYFFCMINGQGSSIQIFEEELEEIVFGDDDLEITIKYNDELKDKVFNAVVEYMKEHQCISGEQLQQSDVCILSAPDVLSDIIDNIIKPETKWKDE
jgi:hypothetical protein